jgi:LPS O-antigen subunit length determinant protein (WzzB/FepE family)
MQDYKKNTTIDQVDLNLKELFSILWKRKTLIFSISIFFAFFSVLYALFLPNIYQSSALLAPATANDKLSTQLSSYSSIAGLAGINIPSGEVSKSQEAVQRIRSLEFFSKFFLPNINLENLLAVEEWIPEANIIKYDEKKFNSKSKKWTRKVDYPYSIIPSNQEAYKKYLEIINITEDKKTAFVTISVKHKSPVIAKNWVDLIIKNINDSMRDEDKEIAQNSINYLDKFSQTTNVKSIKDSITNLLESQLQTLMLTSSNDDYIYKIIDSPVIPELKTEPSRSVISILGTFIGLIFGILVSLFVHVRSNS